MTEQLPGLLPWFGAKQGMAPDVITQLGEHNYYLECCAGSMAVLMAKQAVGTEIVCDLHGGLTNLALVVQHKDLAVELYERLARTLVSEEIMKDSKLWLEEFAKADEFNRDLFMVDFAYHYFVVSRMGRNGCAGTARHNYQYATRWTNRGGNAASRFHYAVSNIPEWHTRLCGVQILCRDLFDVLPKIEDAEGISIYADPPYLPETLGERGSGRYLHDFSPEQHLLLAAELQRFSKARVVVSYYYSEALRALYPGWTFIDCTREKKLHTNNKRGSTRAEAPEVLIVNGEPYGFLDKGGLF